MITDIDTLSLVKLLDFCDANDSYHFDVSPNSTTSIPVSFREFQCSHSHSPLELKITYVKALTHLSVL
jgi:hypothetical protein